MATLKKVGTVIYAVGWTQHSFGTQIIRTAAMLQLLMGNVGRAGGGVNALRGHSNIQGATDMAGIFDILPGYLKMPTPADKDLKTYLERVTPEAVEACAMGVVQLLVEHSEVYGVVPEGYVRQLPPPRKTISPSSICPKSIAIFLGRELERHVRRQGERLLRLRHERRDDRARLQEEHRRPEEGRLPGGLRDLPRRDQRLLGGAGHTPEEMKQINTTVYRLPGAGFAEKDGTMSIRRAGCSGRTSPCHRRAIADSIRTFWRRSF